MNKNFYRIVFNKARGMLMAVAENATSHSSNAGNTTSRGPSAISQWLPLPVPLKLTRLQTFSLLMSAVLLYSSELSAAQILADNTAPANQQPVILTTANGLPLVNIQTPNSAGVSINQYAQFNVGSNGAVLNNSGQGAVTQLAGSVSGNPYIVTPASIILNQVNSSNPSVLQGYLEVAGQRAQVIVANPSGITCSGCGFINASGATLTTGVPQFTGSGSLDGYRVTTGTINIAGLGMDGTQADYTDLIAHAITVNAGIWAKQLNVVVGANQVVLDSTSKNITNTTAITAGEPAPQFAIDVAALGGMYADQISLVGTEAGVGVRNAGKIGSSTGDISISSDGQLQNSGQIGSSGNIQIVSPNGLTNTGSIAAAQALNISTPAMITNSSGTLEAGQLQLSTGNLVNSGTLEQTGSETLTLVTSALSNQKGVIGIPVPSTTSTGTSTGTSGTTGTSTGTSTGGNSSGAGSSTGGTTSVSSTSSGSVASFSPGSITVGQTTQNLNGTITASGQISVNVSTQLDNTKGTINVQSAAITGQKLTNNQGVLSAQQLSITTGALLNKQGKIFSAQALPLSVGSVDNTGGKIQSADALNLSVSNGLINEQGVIGSNGDLTLTAGSFDNLQGQIGTLGNLKAIINGASGNQQGSIVATQNLAITASGDWDNTSGVISGQTVAINLQGNTLHNPSGEITSTQGNIQLQIGLLDNGTTATNGGQIGSAQDLVIKSTSLNNAGEIYALGNNTLTVGQALSNTGYIAAQGNTTITASDLTSSSGATLAAGVLPSGQLAGQGQGTLTINASDTLAVQGVNLAGSAISMQAGDHIDLSNSQTSAPNITLQVIPNSSTALNSPTALTGTLNLTGAKLVAGQTLTLVTPGQLTTNTAKIGTALLNLTAASWSNEGGLVVQSGSGDLSVNLSGTFDNSNGGNLNIASNSFSLQTAQINNQLGEIDLTSQGTLTLQTPVLLNQQGKILSNGTLNLQVGQATLDGGKVAGQIIQISGGSLSNQGGLVEQSGTTAPLQLNLTGDLNNQNSGVITSAGGFNIQAQDINNEQGAIQSTSLQTPSTLIVSGNLDNSNQGQISTLVTIPTISGASTNPTTGGSDLTIQAATINNEQGALSSGGQLNITANQLDNSLQGVLSAQSDLIANTQALNNQQGQIQSTQGNITLNVAADVLNNNQGQIQSTQGITINSQGLTNVGIGSLISGKAVQINTNTQTLDNTNGQIVGASTLNLNTGQLINVAGLIQGAQDVQINTNGQDIDNYAANVTTNSLTTYRIGCEGDGCVPQTTTTLTGTFTPLTPTGILSGGTLELNQVGNLNNANQTSTQNPDSSTTTVTQFGQIASNGAMNINATQVFNEMGGSITSGGTMTITAGTIDNTSVAGNAGYENNQGLSPGQSQSVIVSQGDMVLNTPTLYNGLGIVAAVKGNLTIQNDQGTYIDNTAGQIQAGKDLSILGQVANLSPNAQLYNFYGGVISGNNVTIQNSGIQSENSQIDSAGSMTLNLVGTLELYGGGIQSGGNLTLNANGNDVVISAGSNSGISSLGTISLQNIGDLNVSGGGLLANGAIQINTNTLEVYGNNYSTFYSGLSTAAYAWEGIHSNDSLTINAANTIFNDGSNIAAAKDVNIITGTLNVDWGGVIQSNNGNVNIATTGVLTSNDSSNIVAIQNINLNTQGFNNLDDSSINAGNNIQIENNQQTLTNENSQIAAGQNVSIDSGVLNNNSDLGTSLFQEQLYYHEAIPLTQNALIQAGGNLNITTNGQGLSNQNSVYPSRNAPSGLIAGGALTLSQVSGLNSSQNIQAGQAMSIQADQLTNSNNILSGDTLTISQMTPNLTTINTGLTNNGNIQSQNALQITASQIYNQSNSTPATIMSQTGSVNLQTTAGDLTSYATIASATDMTLTTAGNLNNSSLIQSAGNLTINTNTFTNQGSVLGTNNIGINAGIVNNLNGAIIQSGLDINITAQSLDNSYSYNVFPSGNIYAQGNLNVQLGGSFQNTGLFASDGNTTITAGSVNGSGTLGAGILPNGSMASSGSSSTGILQVTAPTISSSAGVNIASTAITMNGGDLNVLNAIWSAPTITLTANNANYAGTGGNLNLGGAQIKNTNQLNLIASNQLTTDNVQISVPVISVSAGNWSNQGGVIIQSSNTPIFQINLNGTLNNEGGKIESNANNVLVNASSINNKDGKIAQGGTGELSINTGTLSGTGGVIESNGLLQLTTTGALTLDQGNTTAQGIVINAGSLSNQGGLISQSGSGQSLQINDQGDLNNQTGRILSNGGISVNAQNIINTGGKLSAGTQLNIQANSLTGDGIILSQGNANIQLKQDLTLASSGEIETNGTLNLSTAGNIDNSGQLQGQTGVSLTAANLTNESSGTIAGDTTQLNTSGTLTNQGLINGSLTQINANTVNNIGNGQIFGDVVAIAAGTLNNTPQNGTAPVIGARQDMELGVGILNNNPNNINPASGATIISLGNLNIGGSLDSNGNATGTAQQVNNYSGTIQALGNLSLNTAILNNQNNFFTVGYQTTTGIPFDFWIMNSTYDCELPTCGSSVNVNIQGVQLQTDQLFIPAGASAWSASSPLWHDWNDSSDGNLSFITTTYNGVTYSAGNFTHYTGDQSISMPYVVQSDPGQITAGGNLQISTGSLTNNASQIIAGNTLQVNGTGNNTTNTGSGIAYQNTGTTYNETITDVGTSINYWPATGRSGHDGTLTTTSAYTSAPVTQSVSLSIAQLNPSGQVDSAYQSTPITGSVSGTTVNVSGSNGSTQSGLYNAQGSNTVTNQSAQSLQSENINATLIPVVNSAMNQADNSGLIESVGQFTASDLQNLSGNSATQSIPAKGQNISGQQQGQSVSLDGASAQAIKQTLPLSATLPQSGLYTINSSPTTSYVVATNSNFISTSTQTSLTNASQLLQNLQNVSNTNDVLIGDAFYQQQLVAQQVEGLTGQLYLNGYSDTNSEYQALLTNGATFAQQQNLTPGVALTAAQMADLTSDIVWLVNQTVILPNGTTETVLVPQVYLAANTPAVNPDGSVIGGKNIVLNLNGDLSNGGSIVGQNVVSISGNNLTNLGTISGNQIQLNANGDIVDTGGTISAGDNLVLQATGNIDLTSTQDSSTNGSTSQTSLDRVAALSVGGGIAAPDGSTGNLILSADNINLTGATINNQSQNGLTELLAQNNINLNALTNQLTLDQITNSSNYNNLSTTTDIGSSITGAGNVTLDAGGLIAGIAAQINAANNLTLDGVGGIALQSGNNTAQFDSSHVINSSGFFGGSTTHDTATDDGSDVVASNLTAGSTLGLTSSAGDINLQGINLQGSTINLSALQGAINLLAAYNTDQSSVTSVTKISGLGQALSWTGPLETMIAGSNGNGQGMNVSQTGQATTLTAGTGGINIQAQGNITSQGTDLTSGGNITISSSQGQVILGAVNNLLEQASSNSSSNPWLVSSSMSSTTSQTSQLSQMQYAGQLVVNAAQGIQIGIPVSQGASTQNIQTLVTQLASQPGMSWLANMQASGQIDYNQIQQIYQHQSSSSTSLGVASDLVIAIAVTIATAGTGTGAVVAAESAAEGSLLTAGITDTANSLLSGQGLSGAANTFFSKNTLENATAAALTAGIAQGVTNSLGISNSTLQNIQGQTLPTGNSIGTVFEKNLINSVSGALVNQVVYGGNLGQNLTKAGLSAVGNTVGAVGFDAGANYVLGSDGTTPSIGQEGGITLATVHGITGALTGYIIGGTGQSALAGAASGFVTELATPYTAQLANGNNSVLTAINQAIGGLAAGAATGNANQASLGASIAGLETQYNQALHGLHPLYTDGTYQALGGSNYSENSDIGSGSSCATSGSYSVCPMFIPDSNTLNGYAIEVNGVVIGTQGLEVNALNWSPSDIASAVASLQNTQPVSRTTADNTDTTTSSGLASPNTSSSGSGNDLTNTSAINSTPASTPNSTNPTNSSSSGQDATQQSTTTSNPLALAVGNLGLSAGDTQSVLNNLNLMAPQQQLDFLNGIQSGDITANNAVSNSLFAAAQNITGQYMTPSEQTHALLGTLMVVPFAGEAAALLNAGYTVDRASTGGTATDPYSNWEAVGALLPFVPQVISGLSDMGSVNTNVLTGTRSDIPTTISVNPVNLNASVDDSMQYVQYQNSSGGWNWPQNLGFADGFTETTLAPGTMLDRIGEPSGSFLAPVGTSFEQRALAPGSGASSVYQYEVIQPLPVIQGEIAPAFGQPGGGVQMLPNLGQRVNVEWLVQNGYLRQVSK